MLFFFVAFNVIVFTKKLMLEQYGIEFSGFVTSAVGALIVAKVVLLADGIPFINKYPDKPLIYNVVWKTVIYILVAFVVRFLEYLTTPVVAASELEPCGWSISWMKLSGHISGRYKSGSFAYFSYMCLSGNWPAPLVKKNFSKFSWAFRGQPARPSQNNLEAGPEARPTRKSAW